MSDITVLDIKAKGIELTLTIPLDSLIKIEKCIDNSVVNLLEDDEAFVYFRDEFYPGIQEIINRCKGK